MKRHLIKLVSTVILLAVVGAKRCKALGIVMPILVVPIENVVNIVEVKTEAVSAFTFWNYDPASLKDGPFLELFCSTSKEC